MLRLTSLINLAGSLVLMTLSIVSVPIYIRLVGVERYGAILVLLLLTNYLGVFDLGASRSIAYRLSNASISARRRFSAFFTTIIIAAAVSSLMSLLVYVLFSRIFEPLLFSSQSRGLEQDISGAALIILVSVPLASITAISIGACEGDNKFAYSNALSILNGALMVLAPIAAVLIYGASVTSAVAGILGARLIHAAISLVVVTYRCRLSVSSPFDRVEAAVVRAFGGWLTITNLLAPALNSADQLILTATSGVAALPGYSIPIGVVSKVSIVPSAIARAAFPHMAGADMDAAQAIAARSVNVIAACTTFMCLIGFVWLDLALRVWLGAQMLPSMLVVGYVALVGIWANSFSYVPAFLAQARGRAKLIAMVHLAEVAPYLVVMMLSSWQFGPLGAAAVWSLRHCIDAVAHVKVTGVKVPILWSVVPFLVGLSAIGFTHYIYGETLDFGVRLLLSFICMALSSVPIVSSLNRMLLRFVSRGGFFPSVFKRSRYASRLKD